MAIDLTTVYPGQVDPASPDYPLGEPRNIVIPGDGTGTPLDEQWLQDYAGFFQAVLDAAGVTASGVPDTAIDSQYLDALLSISGGTQVEEIAPFTGTTVSLSSSATSIAAVFIDGRYQAPSSYTFVSPSATIELSSPVDTTNSVTVFTGSLPSGSGSTSYESEIYIEDFAPTTDWDSITDWRPIIQDAIDFIQASGKRTKLINGRESYRINSFNDQDRAGFLNAGKNVGIWIQRPDLVSLRGGIFGFNKDNAALAGADEVFSLCNGGTDPMTDIHWSNVRIQGGSWAVETDEPDYCLRADYNSIRYAYFEDCEFRNAQEDNVRMCGFAILMVKPDARFAGKRNYHFVTAALDGDSATRTSICLLQPTAAYAGFNCYRVAGGSGHTYLNMVNPTADYAGRDRAGNTIVANIPLASGYDLQAVFGMDLISLGCEFSTRMAILNGCRGINISSSYCNDVGSTDAGNPVDANVRITGAAGQTEIINFGWNNQQNINNKVLVDINSGANFTLSKDDTILDSEITWTNYDTNKKSPIMGLEHFYKNGARNPGGDSKLVGSTLAPRVQNDWFSQFGSCASKSFLMIRGAAGDNVKNLLTIDNKNVDGLLMVSVKVMIAKSSGGSPVAPAVYEGSVSILNNSEAVTAFTVVSGVDSYTTLTLQATTNTISVFHDEDFSTAVIDVTVSGRPSTGTMTFEWED